MPPTRSQAAFARFATLMLGYLLFVIVFGAWVRITGSGAGCGEHWPTCHGEVLPRSPSTATLIEYTHRLTSGVLGISTLLLPLWAFRAHPRGHAARRWSVCTLLLTGVEAAIGAGLVKAQLVADDASVARAVVVALHLVNTLLLTASAVLTVAAARVGGRPGTAESGAGGAERGAGWAERGAERTERGAVSAEHGSEWAERGSERGDHSGAPFGVGSSERGIEQAVARSARPPAELWALGALLVMLALVAASGAVTALGDTLFPVPERGVAAQYGADHFLVQLRVVHPILAVVTGCAAVALARQLLGGAAAHGAARGALRGDERGGLRGDERAALHGGARDALRGEARLWALSLGGLSALQLALGVLNIWLRAPGWLQLTHLLLAQLLWLSAVLLIRAVAQQLRAGAANAPATLPPQAVTPRLGPVIRP